MGLFSKFFQSPKEAPVKQPDIPAPASTQLCEPIEKKKKTIMIPEAMVQRRRHKISPAGLNASPVRS